MYLGQNSGYAAVEQASQESCSGGQYGSGSQQLWASSKAISGAATKLRDGCVDPCCVRYNQGYLLDTATTHYGKTLIVGG